jgi:RNA polymerase sigma-70 factor (ECF subfamily)
MIPSTLPADVTIATDWSELYAEYRGLIHTYIYRRTNDPTLAEDLTADVFAKAIDACAVGNGARTTMRGWLLRIAHNLVIDTYRQRDRRKQISMDEVPHLIEPHHDPVLSAEAALNSEALDAAMHCLPRDQALVLHLRYFDGYEFQEIADTMCRSKGAVKALQHRGHAALYRILTLRQVIWTEDDTV